MFRRLLVPLCALVLTMWLTPSAYAATPPSGERVLGQTEIEPIYDAAHAGVIRFVLTPINAPLPIGSNHDSWKPFYLPVYPVGSTAATTFNCNHVPVENCPSHGDEIAGAAMGIMPSVYGGGVVGHDHVADVPTGDDFNVNWEVVVVLFTSTAAANEHLVTDAAIDAAADRGDVILVKPGITFLCAVVPATTYNRATSAI
jgi:hypothetical protein